MKKFLSLSRKTICSIIIILLIVKISMINTASEFNSYQQSYEKKNNVIKDEQPNSFIPLKEKIQLTNDKVFLPTRNKNIQLNLSILQNYSLASCTNYMSELSRHNKNRNINWVWMDFNPGGGSTRDGGLFEDNEANQWILTKLAWQDGDPFDNTDEYIPEWSSSNELYSHVRDDEDLPDDTSNEGAWCIAGGENSFWPGSEDSRGWAKCELDFDIEDFIDTSLPGFCFIHAPSAGYPTEFYCDYKIHAADFDDNRNHIYFNIYLDDGIREWPLGYNWHTGEGDMPKNDGWCTDFWDPEYSGCINPSELHNDYTQDFIVNYTSGNTQYGYDLSDFLNNYGYQFDMRFELYMRLYGEYFDDEYFKFWVDHTAIKLSYWFDEPPYQPHTPSPSDGQHYVPTNTNLNWYGGDPDDYIIPMDSVTYHIYLGTSSNPGYVGTIGPYPADYHGPFIWQPPNELNYNEHYYWKIIAEDSYGETSESPVWEFWTENQAPAPPATPSGPPSGWHGSNYQYSTVTTDPENHQIQYGWNWGDGSPIEWSVFYNSGSTCALSHIWNEPGTYQIKVKARDEFGGESGWSSPLTVIMGNRPPIIPTTPTGSLTGWHGISYTYYSCTTDPDNDDIKYYFDWGDGTGGWTGFYSSGSTGEKSHSWNAPGFYEIKVKAQDEYGEESAYCSPGLFVNMGNRAPNIPNSPNPQHNDPWVDIEPELTWCCDDPDGDSLHYSVYFGINNPPDLVFTNLSITNYFPGLLDPNTHYYWRIDAFDLWGGSSIGPVWEFTTRVYNSPLLSNYDGWPSGIDKQWGTCREYFTFKVHYYDEDGDVPTKKLLIVDSEEYEMQCCTPDPSDGDYFIRIQGKVFGGGQHFYHFYFQDGTISPGVRLPENYDWDFTVNYPPEKPGVSGKRKIAVNTPNNYSAMTFDTDGDTLYYWFDWDDGTNSGWIGPLQQGETAYAKHSWANRGEYEIRVCARDHPHGDKSENGTMRVSVPCFSSHNFLLMKNLITRLESPVMDLIFLLNQKILVF